METLHERSFAYDDDNDRFDNNFAGLNPSDPTVLKNRLNKVRKAVHKATQEAWKQASGHSPSLSSLQKENASFLLGMDLFGSGGGGSDTTTDFSDNLGAMTSGLERAVRDKLEQVERDLARIESENDVSQASASRGAEHQEANNQLSPEELSDQIENYRRKVAFLKQASLARSCLEESTALTSSAVPSGASEGEGGAPDNLVRSAQTLLRALNEVDEAERILRDEPSSLDTPEKQKEIEVAQRILSSLRHQIRRHRVELVHKAGTVLNGSVELTPTSIAVKSSAQLTVAYKVLETLDDDATKKLHSARVRKTKTTALNETLRGFTAKLFEEALKPILATVSTEANTVWKVEESSDKRSKMIGVSTANKSQITHRIEWSRAEVGSGDGMDENGAIPEETDEPSSFAVVNSWKNILDVFRRILTFVRVKVFLERDALCSIVGKRLCGTPNAMPGVMSLSAFGLKSELLGENDRGVLGEAMLKWLRDQSLSEASGDGTLDNVAPLRKELLHSTLPFCQEFEALFGLPSEPPSRLISFCKGFETAFIDHRRCQRLNEARDILLHNDYHNTTMVGVEENPYPEDAKEEALAVFRLSRCSISETANNLVALVRKTMDECVSVLVQAPHDSPLAILRPTLYKTAREMFSLYRTIIPVNYGREVANVPRTAAVLHNDAVFLAHHCLVLGLEYQEKFPQVDEEDARGKLLKQTCLFVDLVPLFRELADTAMNDMLDLQKHQLAELVGGRITFFGKSLRSDESVHEWAEADTALAAGIYHLRHLAQAWNSILSKSVFLRSMGYLADVMFSLYLKEVTTNAAAISRSAKQFAGNLFRKALVDVYGVLFDGGAQGSSKQDDPSKYVLEWGRFEAVKIFLDLDQLVHAEQALSAGAFRNLESAKLAKLVTATYQDTPHRRALLSGISSVV